MALERLSIELTNRCGKACWFCYAHSTPAGDSRWTVDELTPFVRDCAQHGLKAVSFGGGEPLEFDGLFDVLTALRGVLFRSFTTNGLLLDEAMLARIDEARPNKVHVSIHFPSDTDRVINAVRTLEARGIRSGVNLLVSRSQLADAIASARAVREAGIGNDRIVYLPMRGQDTPTPDELGRVAGSMGFQSMTCLTACGPSPRFASIAWDKTVAWCSYTRTRRPLPSLTHAGLLSTFDNLGLEFCGGTESNPLPVLRSA